MDSRSNCLRRVSGAYSGLAAQVELRIRRPVATREKKSFSLTASNHAQLSARLETLSYSFAKAMTSTGNNAAVRCG